MDFISHSPTMTWKCREFYLLLHANKTYMVQKRKEYFTFAWVTFLFCSLLMTACGDSDRGAKMMLHQAEAAYKIGDYNKANALIDSLKLHYPKAFDVRRESQRLKRRVTLKEQQENLCFLDSVLRERKEWLNRVKSNYLFEKDTAYQQLGNYLHPSQAVEKCLHITHLSFRVNERGEMRMTSVYCGKKNIHHSAVTIVAPDGTYIETANAKESYETSILGEQIEKSEFKLGEDGGIMNFIYNHRDQKLRVIFKGEHDYSTLMRDSDVEALVAVYDLAGLLNFIYQTEQEREACRVKIEFIQKSIEKEEKENGNQ